MKCPIDGKRCYQHIVAGVPVRCRHNVIIGKLGDCAPATAYWNNIFHKKADNLAVKSEKEKTK